jgi:hypothetical protein
MLLGGIVDQHVETNRLVGQAAPPHVSRTEIGRQNRDGRRPGRRVAKWSDGSATGAAIFTLGIDCEHGHDLQSAPVAGGCLPDWCRT